MRPPTPALTFEYERARKFLRLHFHQSNELGVIEEDSCYEYYAPEYHHQRKTSLSRTQTCSSLASLATAAGSSMMSEQQQGLFGR